MNLTQATLRIEPLTPAIGARITGIDVTADLNETNFIALRDAIHRYSFLVIADQHVTPPQQLDFVRRFGLEIKLLDFFKQYYVEDHPAVLRMSNIKRDGKSIGVPDGGRLWHTDGTFTREPDMYTFMFAVEVPQRDGEPLGDTLFASTAAAFDALPDKIKEKVEGAKAVHSYAYHLKKIAAAGFLQRDEHTTDMPDVIHPLIATHPVTGRKVIYVAEAMTKAIVGMPEAEGQELLEYLWAHTVQDRFVYRHRWHVGDLVIWDNRASLHRALGDYGPIPRNMHRISTVGPIPE